MEQFNILRFRSIQSTNSYAMKHLHSLADRQVVTAERQTRGHGRLGREWISRNPRNVYMSIVLKPLISDATAALGALTQYMSLTLCNLLLEYGVSASIKWPNDVRVKGAKIAGLLGEARFRGEELLGYVLGCGVNLNMSQDELADVDQKATSLNHLVGTTVDRDRFILSLLRFFFNGYDEFLQKGFLGIRESYAAKCDFLDKRVVVKSGDGEYSGIATAFTDVGELVLRMPNGSRRVVRSGDAEALRYV
jgi:BirA family biotin operon repressor/biotin-[acetyl-CoA-carboxylase] ligase